MRRALRFFKILNISESDKLFQRNFNLYIIYQIYEEKSIINKKFNITVNQFFSLNFTDKNEQP